MDGDALLGRAEFLATLPRRRLAAGALIRDDAGRVCLVEPTYKDTWQLPGGTVEIDESPSTACRREVVEELGVELPAGRLLCVDWNPPVRPEDPHGALQFVYDGGVVTADLVDRFVLPADELRSYRFVDPYDLGIPVSASTSTRIAAALRALAEGTVTETDRLGSGW